MVAGCVCHLGNVWREVAKISKPTDAQRAEKELEDLARAIFKGFY
jgi:hypothetical protein